MVAGISGGWALDVFFPTDAAGWQSASEVFDFIEDFVPDALDSIEGAGVAAVHGFHVAEVVEDNVIDVATGLA